MLVRPGFEPTASCSADRRSPNWANRAAVNVIGKEILSPSLRKAHGPLEDTLTFILTDTHRGKANHFSTVPSGWAKSFESSCESLDWSFKSFASLPSISGWPVRTKFRTRGTSLSFPPRPLLALCFHHVCHVIEQGVVLVCRYSHNFHIRRGSPGTSFWMKMFLHLNLINY